MLDTGFDFDEEDPYISDPGGEEDQTPIVDPPYIFDPNDPTNVDPDPIVIPEPGPSPPPGVPLTAVYDPESGTWRATDDSGASTVYGENGKVVASYDETGKLITGTGVDTKTGYQPGSIQVKNPDGTITSRNVNGSTTTFKPDGSILSQTPASPQGLLDFKKAKDAEGVTGFLKSVFAPDGKVSPVAPAIGAIIGMLNRRQGDEGTRGLKDAPAPLVANRQQITQPVGAATGQGQQYFSPITYTKTPEPQNLPVNVTGGGLEGLRKPKPEEPSRVDETGRPRPPQPIYEFPEPQPFPMDVGRQPDYPPQEPKPIPQEPKINYNYRKDIPYYMMEPEVDKNGRVTYPPQYEEPRATIPMIPTPVGGGSMPANLPIPFPMDVGRQPDYSQRSDIDGGLMPMGRMKLAGGGLANIPLEQNPVLMYSYGGLSDLGGYTHAAGGRMLKGPGDGMSDSIPASIAGKQPARLATDEFVIPADVVSHLGNGSSDAGAKVLYDMMARVRKARTGKAMQGKKINPQKLMPR
jgi:hypothetical protein